MIDYENLGRLNEPFFEEFKKAFAGVLEGGWYILGREVEAFEKEFAAYVGSPLCVGTANCLDALIMSLEACRLPAGSEVIVPSNTYIATILAVLQAGFKPVLAEPDIRTYNIDPAEIERRLTPATRALMIVHLYGKSCDMGPILELVKKRGLKLIEDCAQSHGALYQGRSTGGFGDFGAFSFYPTKNLGALGDAGAVVSSDRDGLERIRKLRNYGSTLKYHNDLVGRNSRLDELQAAFLRVKLRSLDKINEHKRRLAAEYRRLLGKHVVVPVEQPDFHDVYHIFNVRHPKRDELRAHLLSKGIKTDVHYPVPPHRQAAMRGILEGDYPISEEIHATTLSLPISFFHTVEDVRAVAEAVNSFA